VIVDEVPVAFKKPDIKDRKFTWIHVPYNNPTWVKVRIPPGLCCCSRPFAP
jgi:hypothetical protein